MKIVTYHPRELLLNFDFVVLRAAAEHGAAELRKFVN